MQELRQPLDGAEAVAAPLGGGTSPALAGAPDSEAPSGLGRFVPRTFEAFRERDFRWFYLSLFGEMGALNMQLVVRGYLAFLITGSYAALGLIGLANALPMLVFSPLGGVIADRLPKRTILAAAQVANVIPAAILTALLFADRITFTWLIAGAMTQGVTMGLSMPARQSILPEIVPAHRLMNAISLNMAGSNTVLLAGPALGGFLVAWAGFEWAYTAMVIAYCVAFVAALRIRHAAAASTATIASGAGNLGRQAYDDIMEGMRYVARDRLMWSLLGLTIVASSLAMAYLFLLPGYVSEIFDGDGSDIGLMTSISAAGSLCAALLLASLPDRRRGYILLVGLVLVGIGHIAFAQVDHYWVAAMFMVVVGLGSAMRQAAGQGLLLGYADEAYRGRVMALFMTQWSTMQIGALGIGVAAEVIGIRAAFVGLGVALLVVTLAAAVLMPHLRRLD